MQVVAVTSKCLIDGCGRMLIWRDGPAVWICARHGRVMTGNDAARATH
jgi:hypothetical protein